MKLRGREAVASASSDRISVERRPVGLMDGRHTRSSVGFTRAPSAPTEKFQQWMSRSVSSLAESSSSGSATSSHEHTHECGRKLLPGRPTKASLLRMKSCPVAYTQLNYGELAKQKRLFAQRCKSLSVSAVLCSKRSNGGTMHGFLTGARYTGAHHLDSRSLDRLGLYIPRRDTTKAFINPGGTTPPSLAIYGWRGCRHSDSHTLMYAPHRRTLSDTGYTPSTEASRLGHVNDSTTSIDREIERVFGPDQGGSGSESSSVIGQFEGELDQSEASIRGTSGREDTETEEPKVAEEKENVSKVSDFQQAPESKKDAKVSSEAGETLLAESPTSEASLVNDTSALREEEAEEGEICPKSQESEELESSLHQSGHSEDFKALQNDSANNNPSQNGSHQGVSPEDQQLDLISPEAKRITDDILRECQSSTSSFKSSSSGARGQDPIPEPTGDTEGPIPFPEQDFHGPIPVPEPHTPTKADKCLQTSTEDHTTDEGLPPRLKSATTRPLSAGGESQLASGRSSTIFVDLTSLQPPTDNGDSTSNGPPSE